jgi:fructose-1,6-bisphosphatase/inositol monophosphatase family enzyme/ADP-ribosylglycohydrolase
VNLTLALETALDAARIGGEILRADFHRAGGPLGGGDKAEADTRAETAIRKILLEAFPHHGYVGEETGRATGEAGAPIWLVDPNDGTRDYLLGHRGSAVSIALLDHGLPVLGVVFAFAYPDDAGDLFLFAEGMEGLERNGRPVLTTLPEGLSPDDILLLSRTAERDIEGSLRSVAPARFRTIPSIAHRLALVAAGEGSAAAALFSPGAWDYGAGHAFLRGIGGRLVNELGDEVLYAPDGSSSTKRAFGGSASAVAALSRHKWESGGTSESVFPSSTPGEALEDAVALSRAQGCLLGLVAGDSLGAPATGKSAAFVSSTFPGGPRTLRSTPERLAGQPEEEAELAFVLARSLLRHGRHDPEEVALAYRSWYRTGPLDLDPTTRAALVGYFLGESKSAGALLRMAPLGLFAFALSRDAASALAREESALTHPSAVCRDAAAALVVAISHALLRGGGARGCYEAARGWAEADGAPEVQGALRAAAATPPVLEGEEGSSALGCLQNAFFEALHAPSLEAGVVSTVLRGGEASRNAAVAGALLGVIHGREAVPFQWRSMVLSARAHPARAARPRPPASWPVAVLEIAEGLVLAGRKASKEG